MRHLRVKSKDVFFVIYIGDEIGGIIDKLERHLSDYLLHWMGARNLC